MRASCEGFRERIAEEIRRTGPIPFSRYMETVSVRAGARLLFASPRAVRQGRRLLYLERCSCGVRAVAGAAVRRDVACARFAAAHRLDRAWPGTRAVRARCAGLVGKDSFPDFSRALRYALVEQSAHLRERLQERLAEHIAAGQSAGVRLTASRQRSAAGENVIIFGNEFFDALPVEVIDHRGALRVGVENGRFAEKLRCAVGRGTSSSSIATAFIRNKASALRRRWHLIWMWMDARHCRTDSSEQPRRRSCGLRLIDYGYTREEQLAGRHRDTIMTYRQHTASASPYEAPGEQDITAHVNFTALRERAVERGTRSPGVAHAIAVSHRHWRRDAVRRRVSGLPAAAGAREGRVAVEAPDLAQRNGRNVSGAGDVAWRGEGKSDTLSGLKLAR